MDVMKRRDTRRVRRITEYSLVAFFIWGYLAYGQAMAALKGFHLPSITSPSPSYGGTLVWGTRNPPTTMNPILTSHGVSSSLMGLIFNSLVRIDSRGEVVPDLAQTWEVAENGLEYIFYLRRDVIFHDGEPFTAWDVKFTYEMIKDPRNNSPWRIHTDLIDSWDVVDPYTLKLRLLKPFPLILKKLIREIVPQHILIKQDLQTTSFNEHPIGTGPFRFKTWDREKDLIILEANSQYFDGRPYLDRIKIMIYPDNNLLWTALLRKEIDLVKFISHRDYQVIREDASFRSYIVKSGMYCAVIYNMSDPILSSIQVRKAIAHSINRQSLIDLVWEGAGEESPGPFHQDSPAYDPQVRPLLYDPMQARQLLAMDGWKDSDQDGVLERDGQQLELKLLIDQRHDMYSRMAAVLRQQLAVVGIKLKVILLGDEAELNEAFLKKHGVQAWLRFFQGGMVEPYDACVAWYSLTSQPGSPWQYRNPTFDQLYEQARTISDEKTRYELYQRMHRLIYEDQPACFLFFPLSYHAVSSRVQNTDALFTPHMPDYVIKDWFLEGT
jgi:peptide/nickel transport system substrate-binding protein